MNVYITYDRYEHNEWFQIYRVETNKKRALKLCKEVDLPKFIEYGPDDCHSFQLQKIEISKNDYKLLCELIKNNDVVECYGSKKSKLEEFMIDIYDKCDWHGENVLLATDGCSDVYDAVKFYCEHNGLNYEDDDIRKQAEDILFNDNNKFSNVLKEYIKRHY